MPNHVCSSAVCINYRYFLLIFQQQEENKPVSQVYTRRLRLKVRSKVRPYVEMASAIFTLFDIQPSFLSFDQLVVIPHLYLQKHGISDAHGPHNQEADGKKVKSAAHGGGLKQLHPLSYSQSVDFVVVGCHQIVLAFLERLVDAAP